MAFFFSFSMRFSFTSKWVLSDQVKSSSGGVLGEGVDGDSGGRRDAKSLASEKK